MLYKIWIIRLTFDLKFSEVEVTLAPNTVLAISFLFQIIIYFPAEKVISNL